MRTARVLAPSEAPATITESQLILDTARRILASSQETSQRYAAARFVLDHAMDLDNTASSSVVPSSVPASTGGSPGHVRHLHWDDPPRRTGWTPPPPVEPGTSSPPPVAWPEDRDIPPGAFAGQPHGLPSSVMSMPPCRDVRRSLYLAGLNAQVYIRLLNNLIHVFLLLFFLFMFLNFSC